MVIFFMDSNCFAGKPIIDCYRLSNRMEFSGCVLTLSCEKVLRDVLGLGSEAIKDYVDGFVLPYLVPLKDDEVRLRVVVWARKEQVGDVRGYVTRAFQSHNKDVSRKVHAKLDNTEIMIRCFLERAESPLI